MNTPSGNPLHFHHLHHPSASRFPNHHLAAHGFTISRLRTPNMADDGGPSAQSASGTADPADAVTEDDPRVLDFRKRYFASEALLSGLFAAPGPANEPSPVQVEPPPEQIKLNPSIKRPARTIDEDDYGDDDDDEEEEAHAAPSSLNQKSSAFTSRPNATPIITNGVSTPSKPHLVPRGSTSSDLPKTSDDARKKLQRDKLAAEEAALRNFRNFFYTLENDRGAMLEQQKLDELDRQVEAEVSGEQRNNPAAGAVNGVPQGSLSSANLGASSLMLKHLLARIDSKRHMVKAQDWQLRKLISEVRKNRSKWASEDKIGQEELYEAAEKVLQELKAMTEYSGPFLQRVNKRDAPDYYTLIKHPMDIGTMMKKLKNLQYKSKKEFVDDLHLIWNNCLTYNSDPSHFLRKKALYMKKQTESLVFLIPDIVIRDRAEVEAEERRIQKMDAELDGFEDSDDEPIMASRGRKAPGTSKGKKGNSAARKAPPAAADGTPGAENKPGHTASSTNLRKDFLRGESDAPMEGVINGFVTPPPGSSLAVNGIHGSGAPPSQADASDADGPGFSMGDLQGGQSEEQQLFDFEQHTWKRVTKKARAMAAAERHRLFINNRINPDEPALLRNKAGMRRWMRIQKEIEQPEGESQEGSSSENKNDAAKDVPGETIAEGIKAAEEENILPDYYDPISAMPDVPPRLRWEEDNEGMVINHAEESLRVVPRGYFTCPESALSRKMEANMRQMQETRKVCAKISVVKQMQVQVQMYQNQFQKYAPQPLLEEDIAPHVVTDDGPVMAPEVCRAALQRSVGKIFFHSGFEDYQPMALEAATDATADFLRRFTTNFLEYAQGVRQPHRATVPGGMEQTLRFTPEEALLHTLDENALDVEALDSYVHDEVDRMGQKLSVIHERTKAHLADLLRPALDPSAGADGAGAFQDDSEQFVSGDYALDIDEDFFGFKDLGLDKEFGMDSLSVPFHLLKNRMHMAYQAQNTNSTSLTGEVMKNPDNYNAVALDIVPKEIGLVHNYFAEKLHKSKDPTLIEDDDLPPKQRFPKPRLPPTGKISSPRKRPLKEQQQAAKKKRKLEEQQQQQAAAQASGQPQDGAGGSGGAGGVNGEVMVNGVGGANGQHALPNGLQKPIGKLKLEVPKDGKAPMPDPEKEDDGTTSMMSPESM